MRQPYSNDVSDNQGERVRDLFAKAETGRPRAGDIHAVVDAIFYLKRTGVQGRYLPHDFPRWDVGYSYFRKWGQDGPWEQRQGRLREGVRQAAPREATPGMACVESQRVQGTEGGGDHGIDGPKKINGVERHIVVDTLGLLLAVFVTAASGTDAQAAREVFRRA